MRSRRTIQANPIDGSAGIDPGGPRVDSRVSSPVKMSDPCLANLGRRGAGRYGCGGGIVDTVALGGG